MGGIEGFFELDGIHWSIDIFHKFYINYINQ